MELNSVNSIMKKEKALILVIDDSERFLADMEMLLEDDFRIVAVPDGESGLQFLQNESADLVLLDLFLKEGPDGLAILQEIKKRYEALPVIMITDYSSVETAVKAMHLGAMDYISKTPDIHRLRLLIEKALSEQIRMLQQKSLQEESSRHYQQLVGKSRKMQNLRQQIEIYAPIESSVLITGETGTGKELVARQLHARSQRHNEPFIPINCAAIPDNLIESELFGYEKGAFTGAQKRKPGKFEVAGKGTLFLDEVSRLSPAAQLKLLRIIQENEFQRVGGNETIQSKCRIVAASNESLKNLVASGDFRDDLYYRLDVLNIEIPALQERMEDLPELVEYLTEQIAKELKFPKPAFSVDAITILKNYSWPGNIRELRNVLTRTLILNSGKKLLKGEHIPPLTTSNNGSHDKESLPTPHSMTEFQELKSRLIDEKLRQLEFNFVSYLLEHFHGNVTLAAKHIGLSRTNFYRMMQRCGYK
jgi:DNA-binding NtrC family response regulator